MEGFAKIYDQQMESLDSQASLDGYAEDGMDPLQPQTLDQIISQNNQELLRRRRTIQHHQQQQHQHRQQHQHQQQFRPNPNFDHNRRASMLEFSSTSNGDLADFQFDPNPAHASMSNEVADDRVASSTTKQDPRRVRSKEELTVNTQFGPTNPNFDTMEAVSAYTSSMMSGGPVAMDPSSAFLPTDMDTSMDYDAMSANIASMNMQSTPNQAGMFTTSPITQSFPMNYASPGTDLGGGATVLSQPTSMLMGMSPSAGSTPQRPMNKPQMPLRRTNPVAPSPLSVSQASNMGGMLSPAQLQRGDGSRRQSSDMQSPYGPSGGMDMDSGVSMQGPVPASYSRFQSAYSSTGFDMLGVLMRVATRANPEINIGPVDLSCAFVVCDIQKHDLPIVYCSDMFERLTGYTRFEILGRNCRFLQAPDGKVQSGIKRKYVDDRSVLYLKNQINKRAEAQLSLINYRKGGQPFMNLLTMIPIAWDTEEYRYFVGFQVDLVEQPNSVSAKNPDGTYEINYNRSSLPAYQLPQTDHNPSLHELGQTISKDEVSQVLATIGNGESELSKRIWDKILLENTDDVVHVLSLKGLFLYLSPACRGTLEYDPSELVGTALSAICHPSDIVPVTRELKDSSNGATVNVVYRIRRKNSGYTWFEAHGCLHTEQGKGRKCIILVGRQRPVYALDRNEINTDGSVGDSELWTKMSTGGMFLYVSSSSRSMLDRLPEDLVGVSMQSLMRPDSRKEFGRALELARSGEKYTFKHDLQNRRGQVLQAQTTIYPGDARRGLKPSFLLAQTRLLKMTRAMLISQQKSGPTSLPRNDSSHTPGTPMSQAGSMTPSQYKQMSTGSLSSEQSLIGDSGIVTQAGNGGLPIGTQDEALASEDNIFDELKTTRSTSWQFELRQMERQNRILTEELQSLLSRRKKRKRRKGLGQMEKDCANCHTRVTPEWRRGPSGNRDLCNSCGLRWAKQNGRVSPRGKTSGQSEKSSTSPAHPSSGGGLHSKENSAGTGTTPASERAQIGSVPPVSTKVERDSSGRSMPPMIEEGQEPSHPDVLPT